MTTSIRYRPVALPRNIRACRLLAGLMAICALFSPETSAQEQLARLRLKNGDFIDGQAAPIANPDALGWQSPYFLTPLEFDWRGVSSIQFHRTQPGAGSQDPFRFLLNDGSCLMGNLAHLDDSEIGIDSASLGHLRVERSSVRQIESRDRKSRVLYEGPISLDEWHSESPQTWRFEGGAVQSVAHHSNIRCAVELPASCAIELRLAWNARPDFVVSLGIDKRSVKDPLAAARLEVWDGQLTIVRESGKNADIAILSKLADGEGDIELTVYLNQQTGLVSVFTASGEMLVKLTVPFEQPMKLNDILVTNGGSQVRVEKLNVYQWDGVLPDPGSLGGALVLQKGGVKTTGQIKALDKVAKTLITDDPQARPINLADVERIVLNAAPEKAPEHAEKPTPASERKPAWDAVAHAKTIDVRLRDGTCLSGNSLRMNPDGKFLMVVAGFNRTVTFDRHQLMTVVGSKSAVPAAKTEGKAGRILSTGIQLHGQLVSAAGDSSGAVIGWKPSSSLNSAAVNLGASGTISYLPPNAAESARRPDTAQNALLEFERQIVQGMPGGKLPPEQEKLLLQAIARNELPPDQLRLLADQLRRKLQQNAGPARDDLTELYRRKYGLPARNAAGQPSGMLMRTGDRIDGEVSSIDERGIHFTSTATKANLIPHEQVQWISLSRPNRPLEMSEEKLQRLLTVPRMSKNDPPTHLLIATNGDYLRGRLLKLDGESATMEVRLEEVQLPRKAIAQIIWLHERNWSAPEDKPASGKAASDPQQPAKNTLPLVHAVMAGGDNLTFAPLSLSGGRLGGRSDLLGDCSVAIEDLSQLLFGPDATNRALELKHESWKLTLARNPKVLDAELADSNGSLEESQRAPLVGKTAPDFILNDLSGKPFELSKRMGRVRVLDFWASWCAPCMATMPEVARVVSETGKDQVDLVAVNLQEAPERIHAAMNKLGVTATVVLDVDGDAAEMYHAQAIPQTVIIDRDGIVRHVFVGGGSRFVKQFHAALTEVVDQERK